MKEVYAIFTTGKDLHDRPTLFGVYASSKKAEREASVLRERKEDCTFASDLRLYSQVTVAYVPVRY